MPKYQGSGRDEAISWFICRLDLRVLQSVHSKRALLFSSFQNFVNCSCHFLFSLPNGSIHFFHSFTVILVVIYETEQ